MADELEQLKVKYAASQDALREVMAEHTATMLMYNQLQWGVRGTNSDGRRIMVAAFRRKQRAEQFAALGNRDTKDNHITVDDLHAEMCEAAESALERKDQP